jgi:hypothetical protein
MTWRTGCGYWAFAAHARHDQVDTTLGQIGLEGEQLAGPACEAVGFGDPRPG